MKQIIAAALGVVLSVLFASALEATEFYVAPDGYDGNRGTIDQPFASWLRAQDAAAPGDTVLFRGGTYVFDNDSVVSNSEDIILLTKNGQPGVPIRYFAFPGEKPAFDFSRYTPKERIRGVSVEASWIHLRGLELRGVQQTIVTANESWAIRVEGGSNNIFELLDLHNNEGTGLFINAGGNNMVLDVDSHDNYDPDRGGKNADGFGCHSAAAGNVFRGCRAWWNSDDGFDFINAPGVCTVENSWSFYNGYIPGSFAAAGDGSGIKAGGFGVPARTMPNPVPRHVVRFNLAFQNRASGFYANHHPGGIDWFNNTAFGSPRNFDMLADQGAADHLLINNLAGRPGEDIARETLGEITQINNSWQLGTAPTLSVSMAQATAPRRADGSLTPLPDLGVEGAPEIGAFAAVESAAPSTLSPMAPPSNLAYPTDAPRE